MFSIACPCCAHDNQINHLADLLGWLERRGAYPYVAAFAKSLAHGPRRVSELEANPPPGACPRGGRMHYTRQRVMISQANLVMPSITGGQMALFATQRIRATGGDPLVFVFATPGSVWESLPGMAAHNAARDAYLMAPTNKNAPA